MLPALHEKLGPFESLPLAVVEEASTSRNAFMVLMASRFEKHLPSKHAGENIRGDQNFTMTFLNF